VSEEEREEEIEDIPGALDIEETQLDPVTFLVISMGIQGGGDIM